VLTRLVVSVSSLAAFVVLCPAPRAPALSSADEQKDYQLDAGHSALRIPFEEDDGHIFLQARINNSAPLWFGLDTGAMRSVIDTRRARTLGLRLEGSQRVGGAGGTEEGSIVKGVSIGLPGALLRNQTLWALSLEPMAAGNGREMAGILGRELFSHFVVDIDYAARHIHLYEPQGWEYHGPGESIPLTLQDGEAYVRAKVAAPGREPVAGRFVIDTGSSITLMLAKSFVDEHKLLPPAGRSVPSRGRGVGGEVRMTIGRVPELQLGRFAIAGPVTAFIETGEIAAPGAAGNIGGRLLRRFRVIFDYARQRMILEPGKYFAEAEEFDMSGAALLSEGPAFQTIRVVRVRAKSPAADAGLRPHDVIVAIDGQPTSALSLSKVKALLRRDGTTCSLRVQRDGQPLEIKVKLRRLI
jgi:hypothetical protein